MNKPQDLKMLHHPRQEDDMDIQEYILALRADVTIPTTFQQGMVKNRRLGATTKRLAWKSVVANKKRKKNGTVWFATMMSFISEHVFY